MIRIYTVFGWEGPPLGYKEAKEKLDKAGLRYVLLSYDTDEPEYALARNFMIRQIPFFIGDGEHQGMECHGLEELAQYLASLMSKNK